MSSPENFFIGKKTIPDCILLRFFRLGGKDPGFKEDDQGKDDRN